MPNEEKQNKIFIIGFSLIAIVVLWFLLKPFVLSWKNGQMIDAEKKANEEILKAPSIVSDDLFRIIQNKSKIVIVDISSPDDFKRGHIAAATNAPGDMLDKHFLNSLGADSTAEVVILNQGSDLAKLAEIVNRMVSLGFVNAKYLRGGIADWREKGYPLISSGGADTDNAKVKKITIDEIKNETSGKSDSLQFLDVRDKDEYENEHVVGALNIPLSDIEKRKDEIPTLKKIIVYGGDENESFQASVSLFDLNFFNIYQMQGTLEDWKNAGGNVESVNSDQ